MAKKKQEEAKPGSPAWMSTFSDLMNLLLCFFVLLFSMSSVDANKWEQVVASMTSAFSVFNEGSASIGTGTLVGAGTAQLSNLDEYYTSLGQKSEEEGDDTKSKIDGKTESDKKEGFDENKAEEEKTLSEMLDEASREETAEMLDQISEMTESYNIYGDIELSMDPGGKYVEIIISGSFLFDSGSAALKDSCLPLLSKVGDILNVYSDHTVNIIGHTDNVPIGSSRYESNEMLSSARAISTAKYLVDSKGIDITRLSWTGRGEYEPIASNATAEGRARNRRVEVRIYNSYSSN